LCHTFDLTYQHWLCRKGLVTSYNRWERNYKSMKD
jgi:hypothetical protein